MTWGMVAVAGASLVGGMMSSNAASDAADAQVNASNNATQSQRDMFNKTVDLESPFRQAGIDAQSKLSYLLGTGNGAAPAETKTRDQIRSELLPQYTKQAGAAPMGGGAGVELGANIQGSYTDDYGRLWVVDQSGHHTMVPAGSTYGANGTVGGQYGGGSTVDETGLNAAIEQQLAKQSSQSSQPSPSSDPNFGSLLKPFDMNDFQMDPGVQFQMKYGQQALQNSQAAQDGVLSGAALKGLIGFNQDYAGLGYQSAFDRYMANKSFTLGSLNDVANRGQAAAGNTVNSAGQFSSGISNSITGAGNASAAGIVGSANAMSGGISGAAGSYMLRNMLNPSTNASSGYGAWADSPMAGTIYSNGSLGD